MKYRGSTLGSIDKYYFVKEMNEGGKYKDYLTIDSKTGKLFFTKLIKLNEKLKQKLNKNIKALQKIQNDSQNSIQNNIAYYYAVKRSNDIFYFVVEYFNGGNLKNFQKNYILAKKSQLTEKFIRNSIYQIISQLKTVYNNKIFYRYVNLEIVMINSDTIERKIVKGNLPPEIDYSKIILDNEPFTLKFGNIFHFQNIEGTEKIEVQNFMSPEIAQKYKDGESTEIIMDKKNDIWSIGVLAYELLTGKKLFEGNNPDETYKNIINGKYTFPKDLKASNEIISFIIELLQYSPDKRKDIEEIKDLPFLKKEVEDFNFIDFTGKKIVELDTRDPTKGLKMLKKEIFGEKGDDNELEIRDKELNAIKKQIFGLNDENSKKIQEFEKELKKLKNSLNISYLKK